MRIAVFTDSYRPYVSGVVNSIDLFSEELRKSGHEFALFAPKYPGYVDQQDHVYRFCSVKAPTNPGYRLAIPLSTSVSLRIKEFGTDIVHTHSPFLMGGLGARVARKNRLPLVFTYHTLYERYVHYARVAEKWAKQKMRDVSRKYCNRCDLVIAPTEGIRGLLLEYGVETDIMVNPTGVEVERFKEKDPLWLRLRYGISETDRVLLYVGRLGKEKSVDFLIRSFRQILRREQDVSLVIVAGGPEESSLKRLAETEGVASKVVFTGPIPPESVHRAYAGGDIFVFASETDTQGMVLTEAMAAGLPVVAVRAFGSRDMVDDGVNGILTEADEEAFASAVVSILQSASVLNRLSIRAREKAETVSTSVTARRLEEAYASLLERHRRLSG